MLASLPELYDRIAYSILLYPPSTPLIPLCMAVYTLYYTIERSYPVILIMWQLDSRVRPGEFQLIEHQGQ